MKHSRGKLGTFAVVTAAALSVAGLAQPAMADEPGNAPSSTVDESRAQAQAQYKGLASKLSSSSNEDLLTFLLTGTGPVADANPGLDVAIGFPENRPAVNPQETSAIVKAYLERYPEFSLKWAPAIKSGDLIRIDKAMQEFVPSLQEFVSTDPIFVAGVDGEPQVGTMDATWAWNAAYVVNVVAGATAYVAAATVGVVTMAVLVWVGAVYLNDQDAMISGQDMMNSRENLAKALAS